MRLIAHSWVGMRSFRTDFVSLTGGCNNTCNFAAKRLIAYW
jgi:hypothetical protein